MTGIRKKPWNRVDQPVYSIASQANEKSNMNICTYAIPVSMKPKRYIVAIYKNTLTEKLVKEQPEFVLQFLAEQHYSLISLLGRKSGFNVDKLKRLKNVQAYKHFMLLPDLVAFVHLKVIDWLDGGDHTCALCEVVKHKNVTSHKPLTLNYLRKQKIIVG